MAERPELEQPDPVDGHGIDAGLPAPHNPHVVSQVDTGPLMFGGTRIQIIWPFGSLFNLWPVPETFGDFFFEM